MTELRMPPGGTTVATPDRSVRGVRVGSGRRVLLLHGGPGMDADVLADLAVELGPGYDVAWHQQRGLAPSTSDGPFTVEQHVADVRAFLDALGWSSAVVVGHSWGAHLLLHLMTREPDLVEAGLGVDGPAVGGDLGMAEFEAVIMARTPEPVRTEMAALDEAAERGEMSPDEAGAASFRLLWPSYFADPSTAPPPPPVRLSSACAESTFASAFAEQERLLAALPQVRVPLGLVAGAGGPMPTGGASAVAELVPDAWVEVLDGVGHVPWVERPGSVRAALGRLLADA